MAHRLKQPSGSFQERGQCSVLRPLPALRLITRACLGHTTLTSVPAHGRLFSPCALLENLAPLTGHSLLCGFPQSTLSSHLPSALSTLRTGPRSRGRLMPQCPAPRHPRAPLNSPRGMSGPGSLSRISGFNNHNKSYHVPNTLYPFLRTCFSYICSCNPPHSSMREIL